MGAFEPLLRREVLADVEEMAASLNVGHGYSRKPMALVPYRGPCELGVETPNSEHTQVTGMLFYPTVRSVSLSRKHRPRPLLSLTYNGQAIRTGELINRHSCRLWNISRQATSLCPVKSTSLPSRMHTCFQKAVIFN